MHLFAQGYNHNYLISYTIADPPWTNYDKGIIKINSANFSISGLSRKMKFRGAQGNIANENGNILFYTNGCWIANVLEDTMVNGTGLSQDTVNYQWCQTSGIPYTQ